MRRLAAAPVDQRKSRARQAFSRSCQARGAAALTRLALGVAAALVLAQAAAASPPAPGFKTARLGMTLAEWRSLAPPPGVGLDATAACSGDERIARIGDNPLSAAASQTGLRDCAYVAIYGRDVLPHSVILDPRYRATGLRYLFDRGRLVEIQFDASIDAYDDIVAQLDEDYGPASSLQRDTVRTTAGRVARVRQAWRAPDGDEITLVDPVLPLNDLRVAYTATASRLAAGRARPGG